MKKSIIALLTLILLTGCASKPKGLAAYADKPACEIYCEGVKLLEGGKYKVAIQDFEALDALYPFSKCTQKGQLDIIYAYYKADDLPSALAAADRYIHLYPRSSNVDYAYYMKGLAAQHLNKTWIYKIATVDPSKRDLSSNREAFATFHDLVTFYPHSPYVCDARKRMIYIRSLLAKHDLDVARFYFKRRAYIAAANRASDVVEHYEGCREVREALQIMEQSYCALGKTDLVKDVQRVYHRTFG